MSSLNFEILNKASADNAEALLHLESLDQKFFPQPWDKNSWQTLFNSHSERWLLKCVLDSETIGFSLFELSFVDSFAHLLKILINPHKRQKGWGLELLNESLKGLRAQGIKSFFLEVEEGNLSAIKLYQKAGFKIIHKKPQFYNNGATALIMTLED